MAKTLAPPPAVVLPKDMVECRVLKNGDGKVSTGEHISSQGDVFYEKGETFKVALDIAQKLEDLGYVEIA